MARLFPGMDPFLEDPAFWPQFHAKFINYWEEALAEVLPDQFEASQGERFLDGARESYVEILQRPRRTRVAILELLSPASKSHPGRVAYLANRSDRLFHYVHLIELDLLLGGTRLPMGQSLPGGSYYYFLSRGWERPNCQVYVWDLPQALPSVRVPLGPSFADVLINLEKVFDVTFERGRFDRRLDYGSPCSAPIPQQWRDFVEKRRRPPFSDDTSV